MDGIRPWSPARLGASAVPQCSATSSPSWAPGPPCCCTLNDVYSSHFDSMLPRPCPVPPYTLPHPHLRTCLDLPIDTLLPATCCPYLPRSLAAFILLFPAPIAVWLIVTYRPPATGAVTSSTVRVRLPRPNPPHHLPPGPRVSSKSKTS